MKSNMLYSNILGRSIEFNSIIFKLFDQNYFNENRSNSLAQKLRKKSLYSLINDKSEIHYGQINRFSEILGLKNLNLFEYINYNFEEKFKNKKIINKNISQYDKIKSTQVGSNLLKLIEEANFEHFTVILHGSHADGNITNYSDIDISIFLKNNLIENLDLLREVFRDIEVINKKIAFHDPISHHKAFLNLDIDLNCYPESFMPIKVLDEGVFPLKQKITFNAVRNDLDLKIENFLNILKTIVELTNNNKSKNLYQVKQIISSYFMLIILEFEILFEKFLDKKTIFEKEIHKYKSKTEINIFNQASLIRLSWPNLDLDIVGVSDNFVKNLLLSCETMGNNIQNEKILKKISKLYLL